MKVFELANLREEISNEATALWPMAQAPIHRKVPIKAQYQLKLK